MDEPRSSSATAPDTASSPAPPDAQQISSDPEPDADDWDVEPGSRKGDSGTVASGVEAAAAQGDRGAIDYDELDDLKRIEEQSRNLELSLSWEDVDEELREFLASGDDEDEDEDEEDGDGDGDGDDVASSKGGISRRSGNTGEYDRRAGDETGRCAVFHFFFVVTFYAKTVIAILSKWALYTTNEAQTTAKSYSFGSWVEFRRR